MERRVGEDEWGWEENAKELEPTSFWFSARQRILPRSHSRLTVDQSAVNVTVPDFDSFGDTSISPNTRPQSRL